MKSEVTRTRGGTDQLTNREAVECLISLHRPSHRHSTAQVAALITLVVMLKEAEFEVGLDANEATLRVIQEQLESDSPLWQTEGAHKVCLAAATLAYHRQLSYARSAQHSSPVICAYSTSAWRGTISALQPPTEDIC